jgi:glycerol kinase
MTAGAAIDWLVRCGLLAEPEDLDAAASAGAGGVEFVPALMGLGSPWAAERARGRFDGLGLETDAAAMVRAVVEGIAQRIADVTETLAVDGELGIDGGLARSDVLAARVADFTGLVVARAAETESTARGAAALAAASPDVPGEALPDPAPARRFEPGLGEAERAERRARWRETVASVMARSER